MILKIIIIAIICIFCSTILKKYNQEFATLVNVCGGVIIFLLTVEELKNIITFFTTMYNMTNLSFDFITILLKALGVGYITEFAADIAEDFGNKMIASKVLLGGKIVLCGMTLPILNRLLNLLLSLLWYCFILITLT